MILRIEIWLHTCLATEQYINLLSRSILQRPCLKLYTGDVYQKNPGTFPAHPTATNLAWSSYPPAASSGSTTEPYQASQHFAITESSNLRNFWAVELVPVLGEKWRCCGGDQQSTTRFNGKISHSDGVCSILLHVFLDPNFWTENCKSMSLFSSTES